MDTFKVMLLLSYLTLLDKKPRPWEITIIISLPEVFIIPWISTWNHTTIQCVTDFCRHIHESYFSESNRSLAFSCFCVNSIAFFCKKSFYKTSISCHDLRKNALVNSLNYTKKENKEEIDETLFVRMKPQYKNYVY